MTTYRVDGLRAGKTFDDPNRRWIALGIYEADDAIGAMLLAMREHDYGPDNVRAAHYCLDCGGSDTTLVGCRSCCRDCGFPCSTPKDSEGFHEEQ